MRRRFASYGWRRCATVPRRSALRIETEREWALEAFARRIPDGAPDAVFGACEGGGVAKLAGIAGFRVNPGLKERHKGMV